MVIDHLHDRENVFAVFAGRARGRSPSSLAAQALTCATAALLLIVLVAPWWPVAAALGAGACYAAWGLLDRRPASPVRIPTLRSLAVLATVFAIASVVGIGLAAFTGDGRSPYGMCVDANDRAFACDAQGRRRGALLP
jgi:hypothetical protein